MNRRRAIVGLCMLSALLISAFAVQTASAVTKGTTAFTCVEEPSGGPLWGEHCLSSNPGNGESQKFNHRATTPAVTTHTTATNEKTTNGTKESTMFVLKFTLGGIAIALTATSVHTTEETWSEDKTTAAGEHYIHGEGKAIFKGVTVSQPPNCKVMSAVGPGEVETNQLTGTTEGQGDNVLFKPVTGTSFVTFSIANNGGICAAAQENINLVGTIKGQPDTPSGATLTFVHETTTKEATVHLGTAKGPVVGLEGKLTYKAGEGKASEGKATNPISATTIETP